MPPSTSPEPAVASHGGASALIAARQSGAAMTVSGPLSTTIAPMPRSSPTTMSGLATTATGRAMTQRVIAAVAVSPAISGGVNPRRSM